MQDNYTAPEEAIDNPEAAREQLFKDMGMPAKPSADTPAPPPKLQPGAEIPAGAGYFRVKEENQEPPPDPEPIFKEEPEPEKKETPRPTKTGLTLAQILDLRNKLQAELLAFIAKAPNPERYQMDEWEMGMLVDAWTPYADWILDKIPAWAPLAIVEIKVMGRLARMAAKDRELNERNAKVQTGQAAPEAQPKAARQPGAKPRTHFKLHDAAGMEGYFKNDRYGEYVRKGDYAAAEKPDLANLAEMKEVIFSNGWDKVKTLFSLPDDWAVKNGIEVEE